MRARILEITPELWVQMLTRTKPQTFRITKNALPEDAQVISMGTSPNSGAMTIRLLIASAVFRDDDPDILPSPVFELI